MIRHEASAINDTDLRNALASFPSEIVTDVTLLHAMWGKPSGDLRGDGACSYLYCRHDDSKICVIAQLVTSKPQHRKAEVAILATRDPSIAYCIQAILRWTFSNYDVNRLECNQSEDGHLREALESAGFTQEAVFDEALFIHGRRNALIVYGLLRPDMSRPTV
jgi:hypothetical protein